MYTDRLIEPELERPDFLGLQGPSPMSILFVIVNDVDLDEGPVGYNPANPPSDEQIYERVDRWWQLQKMLPQWTSAPSESPGLLIGIYGSPGR